MNSNEQSSNQPEPTLKDRFIEAIKTGQLGTQKPVGTIITLKQFKQHFSEIQTKYISSFLTAATLESGQHTMSHTKFVFRVAKGAYLVYPGLIEYKFEKRYSEK